MQKKFKLALCQFRVIDDKIANIKTAEKFIIRASESNPDIIVLPEYFNCPVGMNFTEKHAEFESESQSLNLISSLAKSLKKYIVAGSIPIKDENSDKFYNTSYVFDTNGSQIARHRKVHLFDIDIPGRMTYQESKTLSPGCQFTYFDTEFCRIGLGICYDIRFPEYAQILKKNYNVDLLIYPAAFNTVTGPMHWDLLMRSRALDNNVHIAMCSPAQNTENPNVYQCYGHSSIYDPFAKLISTTGFEEDIIFGEIDLQKNRDIEQQIPTWKQKRVDLYEVIEKAKI
jgi:omega-amidase